MCLQTCRMRLECDIKVNKSHVQSKRGLDQSHLLNSTNWKTKVKRDKEDRPCHTSSFYSHTNIGERQKALEK